MKKDDVEVIKESVSLIVTVFSVLFSNICVCEAVAPPLCKEGHSRHSCRLSKGFFSVPLGAKYITPKRGAC